MNRDELRAFAAMAARAGLALEMVDDALSEKTMDRRVRCGITVMS